MSTFTVGNFKASAWKFPEKGSQTSGIYNLFKLTTIMNCGNQWKVEFPKYFKNHKNYVTNKNVQNKIDINML